MFECRRYRIQVYQCREGDFHVLAAPVEYLGKEEFRRFTSLCMRSFMSLSRKWVFERTFRTHQEATLFAKHLAKSLGEPVFLDLDEARIVVPDE
jgi:hypothetical protein